MTWKKLMICLGVLSLCFATGRAASTSSKIDQSIQRMTRRQISESVNKQEKADLARLQTKEATGQRPDSVTKVGNNYYQAQPGLSSKVQSDIIRKTASQQAEENVETVSRSVKQDSPSRLYDPSPTRDKRAYQGKELTEEEEQKIKDNIKKAQDNYRKNRLAQYEEAANQNKK
jgi:hypothetical protein